MIDVGFSSDPSPTTQTPIFTKDSRKYSKALGKSADSMTQEVSDPEREVLRPNRLESFERISSRGQDAPQQKSLDRKQLADETMVEVIK